MTAKLLIISHDVVGRVMAGPGIRYYHLARVLSRHLPTTLAVPDGSDADLPDAAFAVTSYVRDDWASLESHVQEADVCLFPSDIASMFPQMESSAAVRVVDGYDPLLAEWLALSLGTPLDKLDIYWRHRMIQLKRQYAFGDFYICASERQRDWWLGLLEVSGRINPATYRADPSLRSLIDVVAYGLPETPPQHTRPIVKGVWPGIGPDDELLLWGGGLWPWLDPVTAIQAVAQVVAQRPQVRLIFPGTRHPNPILNEMPTRNDEARTAAKTLGLLDRNVFFGDWVPYADWPSLLLESDLALTLHFETLETRLAFRSRVLDYIWAGLPIVASAGDATAELIARYDLGVVTPIGDSAAVAAAILRLLEQPRGAFAERFAAARAELTWERAAAPLIAFCRNPRRAADCQTRSGENSGSVYSNSDLWELLHQEREYWRKLVNAYESGRFIRLMRWIDRQKQRFSQAKS
jgi:glycosyltransferase involved in cell wall biosynthesis